MIKANELRIGNWVLDDGEPSIVSQLGFGGISFFTINGFDCNRETGSVISTGIDKFKPIPLTPEILEKAGFEKGKTQSSGYYGYSNGIVTLDNDFALGLYDGRMDDPSTKEYYPETKYLHQLQNVYWCLCGSELDIKLQ